MLDRVCRVAADVLGYAEIHLTDLDADTRITFILYGNVVGRLDLQSQSQTAGIDNILPTADGLWAYVHGVICVNKADGAVLAQGSCNKIGIPASIGYTVDQNPDENTATFIIWSNELNEAIYSDTYEVVSVDYRMAPIDNGYDQLFIRAATATRRFPEPTTLLLLGLGLKGLGIGRKMKKV